MFALCLPRSPKWLVAHQDYDVILAVVVSIGGGLPNIHFRVPWKPGRPHVTLQL